MTKEEKLEIIWIAFCDLTESNKHSCNALAILEGVFCAHTAISRQYSSIFEPIQNGPQSLWVDAAFEGDCGKDNIIDNIHEQRVDMLLSYYYMELNNLTKEKND